MVFLPSVPVPIKVCFETYFMPHAIDVSIFIAWFLYILVLFFSRLWLEDILGILLTLLGRTRGLFRVFPRSSDLGPEMVIEVTQAHLRFTSTR